MILHNLPIPTQGFSRTLGALRRFVIKAVVRVRHGFFPKRYLLLAILLVALVISLVPQPTNACEVLCVLAIVGVASLAVKFVGGFLAKVGSDLLEGLITFANWLLEIIGTALWALAEAVARFFTWTLIEFNQSLGFINNDFVQVGWSLVRDVANWLFVIFFLISAIATILNLQKYNARAILPKLIMLAILVNFSLWITGFAVNIAQVVMTLFVVDGAGQYGDIGLALAKGMGWETANVSIAEVANEITESTLGQAGTMFLILLSRIVFALAAIFIFLWLALMLFVRIIYLWIAMILSPLAFAAAAFPKTQPFFSDWLKQFTNWATFGIFAAFFIWLAAMMSAYLQTSFSSTYVLSSSISTSGLMGSANLLMRFITIFVFLWLSYSISKKAAGKAGQFVEGAMKTALMGVGLAGGLAAGGAALKGVGKGAAGAKNLAYRRASGAGTPLAERLNSGLASSKFRAISRLGQRGLEKQRSYTDERAEKAKQRDASKLSRGQHETIAQADADRSSDRPITDKEAQNIGSALERGIEINMDDAKLLQVINRLERLGAAEGTIAAVAGRAATIGALPTQRDDDGNRVVPQNEDQRRAALVTYLSSNAGRRGAPKFLESTLQDEAVQDAVVTAANSGNLNPAQLQRQMERNENDGGVAALEHLMNERFIDPDTQEVRPQITINVAGGGTEQVNTHRSVHRYFDSPVRRAVGATPPAPAPTPEDDTEGGDRYM